MGAGAAQVSEHRHHTAAGLARLSELGKANAWAATLADMINVPDPTKICAIK